MLSQGGGVMISVVNGYVCTSSCDAVSAKQGKDPSAPPGSPPGLSNSDKKSGFTQAATILDGSLKDLNPVSPFSPTDNSPPPTLDRLV